MLAKRADRAVAEGFDVHPVTGPVGVHEHPVGLSAEHLAGEDQALTHRLHVVFQNAAGVGVALAALERLPIRPAAVGDRVQHVGDRKHAPTVGETSDIRLRKSDKLTLWNWLPSTAALDAMRTWRDFVDCSPCGRCWQPVQVNVRLPRPLGCRNRRSVSRFGTRPRWRVFTPRFYSMPLRRYSKPSLLARVIRDWGYSVQSGEVKPCRIPTSISSCKRRRGPRRSTSSGSKD